jgi:hypothetical protein
MCQQGGNSIALHNHQTQPRPLGFKITFQTHTLPTYNTGRQSNAWKSMLQTSGIAKLREDRTRGKVMIIILLHRKDMQCPIIDTRAHRCHTSNIVSDHACNITQTHNAFRNDFAVTKMTSMKNNMTNIDRQCRRNSSWLVPGKLL